MSAYARSNRELPTEKRIQRAVAFWGLVFSGCYIAAGAYLSFQAEAQKIRGHHEIAPSAFSEETLKEDQAEFMKFIATYGKTYASMDMEMEKRFDIFRENLQVIREHNEKGEAMFEMGVNQFSDMSAKEFEAQYLGLTIPAKKKQEKLYKNLFLATEPRLHHEVDTESLPESINWYEKGYVSKPYDQGSCGGCWAFATASALESLAMINGLYDKVPEFSVQQLLDCDKVNYACDGGWMMDGFDYVQKHGIELKGDYKHHYLKRKSKCKHSEKKTAFRNTGSFEEDEVSNERLKELVSKQPVSVAMYSSSSLMHYKHGILTEKYLHCSDTRHEVNHAVVVVGYGKTEKDEYIYGSHKQCDEYWIVRNSWGAKWGEHGFFRLCMDLAGKKHNEQGICQVNYYTQTPTYEAPKETQE